MSERDRSVSRRTALKSAVGAAGGALAAGAASPAAAQEGPDFGGWFDDVSNFDGVVDRTGQDEVTVEVGVQANGGAFGFGPAAVRVSPGTTVVWEWTGEGGAHNVVAEDGTFDSGSAVTQPDSPFEHTFESEGTYRYVCVPHEALGMKGAVVVGGSDGGDGGGGGGTPQYDGWFDDVGNFDGETVDARGQDEVTVTVGAQGNGGAFAFDPPAVHVDNGATVRWEWTGEGGSHNVVAEDGTFDSGSAVVEPDSPFEHTFESDGMYKYVCVPHEALGMKGAVVVGDEYPSTGGGGGGGRPVRPPGATTGLALFGGTLFVMLLSPLVFGAFLRHRYPEGAPARPEAVTTEREAVTEAPLEDDEQVDEIGHDEFDPSGTFSLVLVYLGILVLMWVFMYFVEFLGRVTVVG